MQLTFKVNMSGWPMTGNRIRSQLSAWHVRLLMSSHQPLRHLRPLLTPRGHAYDSVHYRTVARKQPQHSINRTPHELPCAWASITNNFIHNFFHTILSSRNHVHDRTVVCVVFSSLRVPTSNRAVAMFVQIFFCAVTVLYFFYSF